MLQTITMDPNLEFWLFWELGGEKTQRDNFHRAGKAEESNPLTCDTNRAPCWTLFLNHFFIMLNRGETLPATRYP